MRADVSAALTEDHDPRAWDDARTRSRGRLPARLLRLASDERLVELARSGSEAAFEALFDRHHRGVLGFCRHMLGSVEEAEDAVQHTFLAAYREMERTDRPLQLRPWLYTIARNRCITVLRGRRHRATAELADPPTEHLAAAVERRHDLQDMLRDLAGLPEDQRAALVLSELGDMSHDEIAAVVGCRREKVKALVFQARASLIASRTARETPCADIREQLANLRGGSLRRVELKRHVRECDGCREFREQVRAQRRDLAVVLPVTPTVGLKAALFGGTTAGVAGSAASGGVAAKVLVAAVIAGGGTVAVERAVEAPQPPVAPARPAPVKPSHAVTPRVAPARAVTVAPPVRSHAKPAAPRKAAKTHANRGASATAPGRVKKVAPWKPPGQAKKPAAVKPVPPGQANKPAAVKTVPPGQANKPAAVKPVAPGQAKKSPPPGQVKKVAAAVSAPKAPKVVEPPKAENAPKVQKAPKADPEQG